MKTCLVTGGAGFIGSHLCERLLNEGFRVLCVDNFFVGSEENIAHLRVNKNFVVIEHNIIEPLKIDEDVQWIFNFACPASPVHYQYDPIFTLETNVIGVKNMLELARRHNARIMQASTSEVYGDPTMHPQSENYWGNVNCAGVRACYDEGKRAAETLMFDFHRERSVDIRVIRIFNTYGPRMAVGDGRVVSNFVVQALQEKPITIYGDGSYSRSFQYIDDLVEGIMRMMAQEKFVGPVNLGNPHEFTVKELAVRVRELTGSTSEIIHKPQPSDDPKQRQPDISCARELLAWEPKIELEEGLEKTIAYFKEKITREIRVAIFVPIFDPNIGLQESFVDKLTHELRDIHFDIFTMGNKEVIERDNVTLIQLGSNKIAFPFHAARAAQVRERMMGYQAVWAMMGSYGGFAAWLFKKRVPRAAIFLSLDSNEVEQSAWSFVGCLKFVVRMFARRAASYIEIVKTDGSISLDTVFSGTRDEMSYSGYRFRQLFYRLGLEKEFGRPFVMMKRLFDK